MAAFQIVLDDGVSIEMQKTNSHWCRLSILSDNDELGHADLTRESLTSLHFLIEAIEYSWREE